MDEPTYVVYVHGSQRYEESVALRDQVLRKPLGLEFSAAQLAAESGERHMGLAVSGALVAVCVARDLGDGVFQVRQVAVAPERQGQGLGFRLMREAEASCALEGARRVIVHARDVAVGFYLKLGYRIEGEPFVEVGIQHRLMTLDVRAPDP